ncbi:Ribosomal protein L27 family protein [Raphanus sativus]|nr:Ribosomal protein L27 family protein [Raphanus sativus]
MNFLNSAASICKIVSLRELITEVATYGGSGISDGSSSRLSLVFKRWATKKTSECDTGKHNSPSMTVEGSYSVCIGGRKDESGSRKQDQWTQMDSVDPKGGHVLHYIYTRAAPTKMETASSSS